MIRVEVTDGYIEDVRSSYLDKHTFTTIWRAKLKFRNLGLPLATCLPASLLTPALSFTHAHTQGCDTGSTIHPLGEQSEVPRFPHPWGLLKLQERGQGNTVVGSEGLCFLSNWSCSNYVSCSPGRPVERSTKSQGDHRTVPTITHRTQKAPASMSPWTKNFRHQPLLNFRGTPFLSTWLEREKNEVEQMCGRCYSSLQLAEDSIQECHFSSQLLFKADAARL